MTEKKNIYSALAKFQGKCPEINLDGEVKFGNTNFKYATLANIIKTMKGELAECGLAVFHTIDNNKLTTVLCHSESGETIESSMEFKDSEDAKKVGAQITYLRRYMLNSILGIAPEDDKDATGLEKAGKKKLSPDQLQRAIVKIIDGADGANLETLHRAFDLTHEQIYMIVDAERKAIERLEGQND